MDFFQAGDDDAGAGAAPQPVDESVGVTAAAATPAAAAAAAVVVESVPANGVRTAAAIAGGKPVSEATAATATGVSCGFQQGGNEMVTSPPWATTTMAVKNRTLVVYPPECLLHM